MDTHFCPVSSCVYAHSEACISNVRAFYSWGCLICVKPTNKTESCVTGSQPIRCKIPSFGLWKGSPSEDDSSDSSQEEYQTMGDQGCQQMPGQTPQQNQGGHVTLSGEQLGELLRQTGEAAANAATQASTQAFSMMQQQLQRALEVTAFVDLDPGFSWDKKLLNMRQGSRPFADYAKEFRTVSAKADFGGRGLSSILRNSLSRELKAKVSMEDVSGLEFTALVDKLLRMD